MWFPSVQILETESLHKQPTYVTDLRNWYLNRYSVQNIRWPLQHTWLDLLCLCEICINVEQKLSASVTEWGKHRGFNDNSFWVWIKPPNKLVVVVDSLIREKQTLSTVFLYAQEVLWSQQWHGLISIQKLWFSEVRDSICHRLIMMATVIIPRQFPRLIRSKIRSIMLV
jgi:hypothetical protein